MTVLEGFDGAQSRTSDVVSQSVSHIYSTSPKDEKYETPLARVVVVVESCVAAAAFVYGVLRNAPCAGGRWAYSDTLSIQQVFHEYHFC